MRGPYTKAPRREAQKVEDDKKGVKLKDDKLLAGKGRLTDVEIDHLQRY